MAAASLVFAILAVGLLIIFHEAGHFFAARRAGMKVSRFSVGFGPAIFKTKRGDTEFMISAIPLGGYVQIDGMSPHDGTDPNAPGSYQTKPFHQKFATIMAGPAANYLLGFVLLLVWYGAFFAEMRPPIRVTEVLEGSAAAEAGLQKGDLIVGTASTAFVTMDDFQAAVQGAPPVLRVLRDGQTLMVPVAPKLAGERKILGVGFSAETRIPKDLGLVGSVKAATTEIAVTTVGTVLGFAFAIGGLLKIVDTQGVQVTGPIGIVKGLSERAQRSVADALADVARLSVALGLFNLFPIPALDGSRLMFLLVGAVRRRPVDARIEQVIHLVGLALLLGLFIVISVGDVLRP